MLRCFRGPAALLLLVVMAANFFAEGLSLYAADLLKQTKPAVCHAAPKAKAGGCCSAKVVRVAKSCGCPHCGDHCPMGDACRCDARGKTTPQRGEMFFRAPGCHSGAIGGDSELPLSMRVIFVMAAVEPAAFVALLESRPVPGDSRLIVRAPAPAVPPPRYACA